LFLYPDTINWIQGEGKDSPQSNDPPAQAGFDHGDNTRYYTLPGSGMPQVNQLARSADCLTQWEGALYDALCYHMGTAIKHPVPARPG